jgi:hypothetical protein
VESIEKKGNTEKIYFYLRHNILKKANLDQAFGESRSGMITHKNQTRITAGTQCGQKMKSISLETPYFSGMVCPVGVLAPAKIVSVTV